MGMYTEIRTNLIISDPKAAQVVRWMCRPTPAPPFEFPDHPLFRCSRWNVMLVMHSAYFNENYRKLTDLGGGRLYVNTCSNLKNYDGEVCKFAEWITPYCEPQSLPIVTEEYEDGRNLVRYFQDGHADLVRLDEET